MTDPSIELSISDAARGIKSRLLHQFLLQQGGILGGVDGSAKPLQHEADAC